MRFLRKLKKKISYIHFFNIPYLNYCAGLICLLYILYYIYCIIYNIHYIDKTYSIIIYNCGMWHGDILFICTCLSYYTYRPFVRPLFRSDEHSCNNWVLTRRVVLWSSTLSSTRRNIYIHIYYTYIHLLHDCCSRQSCFSLNSNTVPSRRNIILLYLPILHNRRLPYYIFNKNITLPSGKKKKN